MGGEKTSCLTCGRRRAVPGVVTSVPLTSTATTGAGAPPQQR